MQRTPSPRLLNIARALELQAAEAEGLSNRLRVLGHSHEANKVYRAGKDLVLVAKTFLGTSETFNLFFHKGEPFTEMESINKRDEGGPGGSYPAESCCAALFHVPCADNDQEVAWEVCAQRGCSWWHG